jgi:hypothetical protein
MRIPASASATIASEMPGEFTSAMSMNVAV